MNAKKAIMLVVLLFLGFWLFTDPNGLAEAAKAGLGKTWQLTQELFRAIIRFVDALN